jgi:hypothetical protein
MAKDTNDIDETAQTTALEEVKEAHDRWRKNRRLFPKLTMTLALKLRALRDAHPSNVAFSTALESVGLGENELKEKDRAALLNMALPANVEISRKVLAKTDRWSPQHIWRQEISPLVNKDKPEAESRSAHVSETTEPEREPVEPIEADKAAPVTAALASLSAIIAMDHNSPTFASEVDPAAYVAALSIEEQDELLQHVQAVFIWSGQLLDQL